MTPPHLLRAQGEEERFLNFRAQAAHAAIHGFHPADANYGSEHGIVMPPILPPAPGLPRHLDKVILNMKPPGGIRASEKARLAALAAAQQQQGRGITAMTGIGAAGGYHHRNSSKSVKELQREAEKSRYRPPGHSSLVDDPLLGDDESVLPVPSHVVLHHLGTSAIRDGVLAVADTTRYRQKYITTVYYKPT